MHERLLEMGRSLPSTQPPAPVQRDTYTKERASERETAAVQSELSEQDPGRNTPDSTGRGTCDSTN